MDVLQKGWGWLLGLGILLAVLGVLLIAAPALGTLAVDLLVAWFLIIGGVAQAVHAFMEKAWRGFLLELASGVLFLVVGGLLLFYPMAGAQALTLVLAAFLLVEGIVRIAMALRLRPAPGWGWLLFGGIMAVILALLIWVQWPASGLLVLGLLIGINFLFTGWSLIMVAIAVRSHESRLAAGTR
jgi:uncharacterized membrane protein HdeD (DUF308 family)